MALVTPTNLQEMIRERRAQLPAEFSLYIEDYDTEIKGDESLKDILERFGLLNHVTEYKEISV